MQPFSHPPHGAARVAAAVTHAAAAVLATALAAGGAVAAERADATAGSSWSGSAGPAAPTPPAPPPARPGQPALPALPEPPPLPPLMPLLSALEARLDALPTLAMAGVDALPDMPFVSRELSASVVKGAPYTAEAITETVQTLADGNRIVHASRVRLARDGDGRTRQERLAQDGTAMRVFIADPVAGERHVLSPSARTAVRLSGRHGAGLPDGDALQSWGEQMREWARDLGGRIRDGSSAAGPEGPEGRTTVRRVTRDGGGEDVRVEVVRVAEGPAPAGGTSSPAHATPGVATTAGSPGMPGAAGAPAAPPAPPPPIPPLPPERAWSVPSFTPPPGPGVVTSLGSRDIEGVRADGMRTTWTIPAGRIGNEKPIEVVSERWYSADLMLVVSSRQFDPRTGETRYRLANLKRGAPDPALFRVPPDYARRGRG